ncbi:hypothetical protein GCM10010383_17340 [Streptomyces lomondensis]|uniref:Uncharacterized protein n=1 Tax=Streptomyces lomondensis TaxID=68229 RepID=A0ABQ2X0A0_9ACTN|nr:hypothetical protein GCM10010383_17340 [Streptomyces lomondensis]
MGAWARTRTTCVRVGPGQDHVRDLGQDPYGQATAWARVRAPSGTWVKTRTGLRPCRPRSGTPSGTWVRTHTGTGRVGLRDWPRQVSWSRTGTACGRVSPWSDRVRDLGARTRMACLRVGPGQGPVRRLARDPYGQRRVNGARRRLGPRSIQAAAA